METSPQTQEGTQSPQDTRMPPIYELPVEVLGLALNFLDPGRSTTALLPDTPHNNKIRKPLYNLCLTSKRFCDIALPILYRNITVVRADKLVLLFRSIVSNPSLRPFVRSFSYLLRSPGFTTKEGLICWNNNVPAIAAMSFTDFEQDVIRHAKLYLEPVSLPEWYRSEQARTPQAAAPSHGLFVRLTEVILGFSELLDDVLIQLPMSREYQSAMFSTPRNLFDFRTDESATSPVVKSATRAKSIACARFRVPNNGIPGVAGVTPTVFRSWLDGATTRLELCGDNGHWFGRPPTQPNPDAVQIFSYSAPTLLMPWDAARLSAIKDLRLYNSGTSPTVLYHLLEHCNNLRSLHYSFTRTIELDGIDSHGSRDMSWGPFKKTLNEAISQCSDRLVELQLECLQLDRASRLSSSGVEALGRGFELVKCLTEFRQLKHLSIDARRLFGHTILHRTRNWTVELCSLLPPSLVELELVENICTVTDCSRFGQDDRTENEYGEWITELLLRLTRQRNMVPRLRKIKLDVIQPTHKSSMTYLDEISVRMISTLRDYGIELVWRWKRWQ
ncbi:hypothetical protein F5X96DRAFT_613687 [Biscogniauxia mediterranea]|nr:hypothetical protein F5X96DRAFT_613687 [Biscogniauxia mediterranea]